MIELSFGQVEAILADVNRIAGHKRVAFAGRLKFLQKNGVPNRPTPGRGKAGTFTYDHLLQMGLALELLQCGLSPLRAAEVVGDVWVLKADEVLSTIRAIEDIALAKDPDRPPIEDIWQTATFPWVWSLRLAELSDLTDMTPLRGMFYLNAKPTHQLSKLALQWDSFADRRATIINAFALINKITFTTVSKYKFANLHDIIADLESKEPHLRLSSELFDLKMAHVGDGPIKPQTPEQKAWLAKIKSDVAAGNLPTEIGEKRAFVRSVMNTMGEGALETLQTEVEYRPLPPRKTRSPNVKKDLADLAAAGVANVQKNDKGQIERVTLTPFGQMLFDLDIFVEEPHVDQEA